MNDIAVENATARDSGVQVLLIHGGFHGSWVWDKVVDRLAALGWPAQTFELPSVAAKGRRRYGMCDDALAVRRRLQAIGDPVVVLAHSYGDAVTARRPLETFYADVPSNDATRAIERLQPSSYSTVTERLTAAAWREIPSTYVICDEDQAIAPAAQEQLAKRATNIRRLPSGHSPMLSRPAEVAQIITEVMTHVVLPR